MSSADYISFAHTASKEWVLSDKFRFRVGTISRTARPPYTYNCGLKDNTTTVLEITTSSATAFRVVPDAYGATYRNGDPTGGRREMYFILILGEGVTRPMTWYAPTVVDKFQGGSAEAIAPESGKTNIYHIFEYQEGHFAVEKLGWTENQLTTLSSAIPSTTSQLTNDSGFITLAQVPTPSYIEDATGNKISANLSCIYIDDTAWEVTDPSSNKHILEYVGFIQSYHTWECVEPENIKLVLTYANDWLLRVYTWQEIGPGGDHDWVLDITGSYDGDSDITTIPYFVNAQTTYNYSAQRPVTKHMTLATKEYVDSRLSALEARIAALENNNQ